MNATHTSSVWVFLFCLMDSLNMNHASLFSGIGGFDLASQWMAWNNILHCEINPFCQQVLKYYWPNATSYTDITKTDFTIHRGAIDILTGGFPCQPYSVAGKRKGKEDARHLWPEMLRAIREIQPRYVVGENVGGLISWNGGMVFDEVQTDLEAAGYEVLPFLLPACGVNAPHKRERVWFIAYTNGCRSNRTKEYENSSKDCGNWQQSDNINNDGEVRGITSDTPRFLEREQANEIDTIATSRETWTQLGSSGGLTPNTNLNQRSEGRMHATGSKEAERYVGTRDALSYERNTWQNFPTQSPLCNGNDGLSTKLDGITFSKWRNESIKAGGNAIVPQVALQIFKAIKQYELSLSQ
jgi:DNA (cytosine-5)-methyltransferase 1